MAPHVEPRQPAGAPPPAPGAGEPATPPAYLPPAYTPPAYPPGAYPPPSTRAPGYPTYPTYPTYPAQPAQPALSELQRAEQRWIVWCFTLAVVSFGLFIPLLGIAMGAAQQFAVGFGGFLLAAAIPAVMLVVINVAFVFGTRPRQ